MTNITYRRVCYIRSDQPFDRIAVIICPNYARLHQSLYMRYIMWYEVTGGQGFLVIMDDPSYEEVCAVVKSTDLGYKNWLVVEAPCQYCTPDAPE